MLRQHFTHCTFNLDQLNEEKLRYALHDACINLRSHNKCHIAYIFIPNGGLMLMFHGQTSLHPVCVKGMGQRVGPRATPFYL